MSADEVARALAAPALWSALCDHAAAWYPRECCALIVRGPTGPELVLADNLADRWHLADPAAFPRDARRAFLLDPRLIAASERGGRPLLAVVHSHVDVGAYFSDEDSAGATAPAGDAPLFPGVAQVVLDARADGVRAAATFTWCTERRRFVRSGAHAPP